MILSNLVLVTTALAILLTGCSGGKQNDALARERASMEAEEKAMAEHQALPAPTPAAAPNRPSASGTAQSATEPGARLSAGTPLRVKLAQSMSSRTATTGADWAGKLAEDLKAPDGRVLAKAGSNTKGRLVLVSDGTNLRRRHELEIRVFRIETVSGDPMDIRTTSFIAEGANDGQSPAIIQADAVIDFRLASETAFP